MSQSSRCSSVLSAYLLIIRLLLHGERCWYRTAQIAEIPAPSASRGRLRGDLSASPTPALCPNMAANESGHHGPLEASPLPLVRFQSGPDKRKCSNKDVKCRPQRRLMTNEPGEK